MSIITTCKDYYKISVETFFQKKGSSISIRHRHRLQDSLCVSVATFNYFLYYFTD